MNKARRIALTVICIFAFSAAAVHAGSIPRISIDASSYKIEDGKYNFLSGSVSPSMGQMILLLSGDKRETLGKARVAKNGGKGYFSIEIPQKVYRDKTSVTVYVKSTATTNVYASKYIAVTLQVEGGSNSTSQTGKEPAKPPIQNIAPTAAKKTVTNKPTVAKKKTVKKSTMPAAVTKVRQKLAKNKKPTAAEGRAAAVAWARMIAADNTFSYGAAPYSHHNGCYFCKTNGGKKKRARKSKWARGYKKQTWDKTYCCNPFVHASYAHGAGHPRMLRYCKKKSAIDMTKGTYRKMGCFKCIGKPDFNKLIAGDVFVSRVHVWIYCGKGQMAEATSLGGGVRSWSSSSIRVTNQARKKYGSCKFVMRFTGY